MRLSKDIKAGILIDKNFNFDILIKKIKKGGES